MDHDNHYIVKGVMTKQGDGSGGGGVQRDLQPAGLRNAQTVLSPFHSAHAQRARGGRSLG